jgi:hypothetical protein
MRQQTDKGAPSPVPSSACCRELESSSRVSGSESRHRVFLLLRCLGLRGELPETPPFHEAVLEIIHETGKRFHCHTERNAANEEQTLLPGDAGTDVPSGCRRDTADGRQLETTQNDNYSASTRRGCSDPRQ